MGLTVSGGSQVRAKLGRVAPSVRSHVADAVQDEAEAIASDERADVPVLSGDLQAGIRIVLSSELTAVVGIRDDELIYAVWIEWGRSRAPAQPFATPAAEQARQRWPRRAADAVKRGAEG